MEQVWTAHGQEPRELCADAALRIYDLPPTPRRRSWLGVAATRAAVAAALGLAWLGLAGHHADAPPSVAVTVEIPYAADPSLAPLIAFPALPRDAARYVARSRGAHGGRWDTLTSGDWTNGRMFVRVTVRQDEASSAPLSLFVDLATQAAELGAAVLRSTSPEALLNGRSRVEWSEAIVSDASGERSCLGFLIPTTGAARVSGLACASRGERLDRANLECLIGALSVTQAGLSAGLGAVLPNATSRRAACANGGA